MNRIAVNQTAMNPYLMNENVGTAVDMAVLTSFESIQMDGEPDLIVELIDLYLEDVLHRIELMREAVAGMNHSAIKREAHALKGSSSNLGMLQIAIGCELMERLEFKESSPSLELLVDRVDQEFSRVRPILLEERRRRLQ